MFKQILYLIIFLNTMLQKRRQIGFIKNYSYTSLPQGNIYKASNSKTPLQKPEFSSFHYDYHDSDDNQFSLFQPNQNKQQKLKKYPKKIQYKQPYQQKKTNMIKSPSKKISKQEYKQSKKYYDYQQDNNQRILTRNYYSTSNLVSENVIKNQRLFANKKKLQQIGTVPLQVNSKKIHQINFTKKNQPNKQVQQSQVIQSSQQFILRKKVPRHIPPPVIQKPFIKQKQQQEKQKINYSFSSSSSSGPQQQKNSFSQQSSSCSQPQESEPSQILPKKGHNSFQKYQNDCLSYKKGFQKNDNKIIPQIYEQHRPKKKKTQQNIQNQIHKIENSYPNHKNRMQSSSSSSSSEQKLQFKQKKIIAKHQEQQYEKQGILVSKGGLCFDINPKDFVVPQQEARQLQKKQIQTKKTLNKQKKNINSVDQKRRRRQLAKNYDRYARHQIFGNY